MLWLRKDSLAVGNVTGAMVFQSSLPVAIGVAFTDWKPGGVALLAGVLALVGGSVALWAIRHRGRFSLGPIVAWLGLFSTFATLVWLVA